MEKLKQEVYDANIELVTQNLVIYTWGNVSAIDRETDLVVIKPSGVKYDRMKPSDMVVVDLDGNIIEGEMKPSSDTPTHLELYRCFKHINGVVHTHSEWATSWAQACRDVPSYGTTHADYFYGDIPCTRSLTKEEIKTNYELNTGKVIIETLVKKNYKPLEMPGIIVSNHGPFTWGESAMDAVHNAKVVEEVCKMAFRTEKLNQTVKKIDDHLLDKHYLRKHGKNAYYGQ
ncbi:MAG: L-ribulose-5-phosphate 4-epimerase [Clostridiales bacterium]|nr:L-ribulose-5-phosphate 4-epimerase [Clostridiales bacterium]